MTSETMRKLADHFREVAREATGGSLWLGVAFIDAARIIEDEIGPPAAIPPGERERLSRAGVDVSNASRMLAGMLRGSEPADTAKLAATLRYAAAALDNGNGASE